MLTRRGLIRGLGALIAAPAIVRASSLMPLSLWKDDGFSELLASAQVNYFIVHPSIERDLRQLLAPTKANWKRFVLRDLLPPGEIGDLRGMHFVS